MFTAALFFALAPIPKQPPPQLTAEMVLGLHEYTWSGMVGWIQFDADGCYISQHKVPDGPYYAGKWSVKDLTLTLMEGSVPTKYEFVFDAKAWPALAGKSNGTTDVKLRRFPDQKLPPFK